MSEHEETLQPSTFGATPSSADAVEETPSAPGRQRTSAWPMWVLGLVIMVDQIDQNIVRGLVTPLKDDLELSDFQIGMLLSSFVLVNGLITVPAGYLADRWNRTRRVGHTGVAWSAITAFSGLFRNFGWLLGVRSALGFGQAITEPACASLIADDYPAEERGEASPSSSACSSSAAAPASASVGQSATPSAGAGRSSSSPCRAFSSPCSPTG